MAKQPAKDGKVARAHAPAMEDGVCIICGEGRKGIPAGPSIPIRLARWLRAAMKQPAKHTIACSEHLEEARAKRAKFDSKKRSYLLGAIAFFAIVMLCSVAFGIFGLWLLPPALLGAFFVAMLPYFYYFPPFG